MLVQKQEAEALENFHVISDANVSEGCKEDV